MRRASTWFRAVPFALSLFASQAVLAPVPAAACYCTETTTLAETKITAKQTIVVATVGAAQVGGTPLVVDTWFHGPFVADVLWLRQGAGSSSSCDVTIKPGERRFFVLYGGRVTPGANGLYSTSLCDPTAVMGTQEGDALFETAKQMFGFSAPPPGDAPSAFIDVAPWMVGLPVIAAISALALAYLGIVVLVARRRRS